MRDLGKLIVAQSPINRQIWSHWSQACPCVPIAHKGLLDEGRTDQRTRMSEFGKETLMYKYVKIASHSYEEIEIRTRGSQRQDT